MAGSGDNFEIIDGHLHVYDLKLKAGFPNQNWTIVDFPDKETESAIHMDITQEYAKEIANKSGVKKEVIEKELEIIKAEVINSRKPKEMAEKISKGKISKFSKNRSFKS